jgi:hypothetical protein
MKDTFALGIQMDVNIDSNLNRAVAHAVALTWVQRLNNTCKVTIGVNVLKTNRLMILIKNAAKFIKQ